MKKFKSKFNSIALTILLLLMSITFTSTMASASITDPMIAGGDSSAYALKSDGTVWSWGSNNNGQLGDGTEYLRTAPVQVLNLTL